MIIQNESDLAMIPMSSVLLIAVTGTIFLSKTVFFSTIFTKITKYFFVMIQKQRKIYLKRTGIGSYDGQLSPLSKISDVPG